MAAAETISSTPFSMIKQQPRLEAALRRLQEVFRRSSRFLFSMALRVD
jgi:hypothetical protein